MELVSETISAWLRLSMHESWIGSARSASRYQTSERLSHGAPAFFIREKRSFLTVMTNHHGDGRFAIWYAAAPGTQDLLVRADSERFFVPPYVGHRGWLGVRLDRGLDWDELAGIIEDAYAEVAPARLVEAARQSRG